MCLWPRALTPLLGCHSYNENNIWKQWNHECKISTSYTKNLVTYIGRNQWSPVLLMWHPQQRTKMIWWLSLRHYIFVKRIINVLMAIRSPRRANILHASHFHYPNPKLMTKNVQTTNEVSCCFKIFNIYLKIDPTFSTNEHNELGKFTIRNEHNELDHHDINLIVKQVDITSTLHYYSKFNM